MDNNQQTNLIPVSGGIAYAIVDAEDYERLSQFKWRLHKKRAHDIGYPTCHASGKHLSMHRLLITPPSGLIVDHINGNPLDNRKSNLRVCDFSGNGANRRRTGTRFSKYRGVFANSPNSWGMSVWKNRKNVFRKYYTTEIEAALAYDHAAYEVHGKFAKLNFPELLDKTTPPLPRESQEATALIKRQYFRCSICGRFLHPESSFTRYDFTPETDFTRERVEFYHTYCDVKTGPRSTFKMDFLP